MSEKVSKPAPQTRKSPPPKARPTTSRPKGNPARTPAGAKTRAPESSARPAAATTATPARGRAPSDTVQLDPQDTGGYSQHAVRLAQGLVPDQLGDEVKRATDLFQMGTHLPELMRLSESVEKNGFRSEDIAKLKAMEGDLKDVITPENMAALKGLDADGIERMFSPENLARLKELSPQLGEQLTPERVDTALEGLRQLQEVDRAEVNQAMNTLAPWVNTLDGQGYVREGHLNMLDRMVADPSKLGGGDRVLSQEDIPAIVRGAMRHPVTHEKIDQAIRSDPRVNYNRRGRPRVPMVRETIVSAVHRRATPQAVADQVQAHSRDQLGSVGLPDSQVPRSFTSNEMSRLFRAGEEGKRLQSGQDPDVARMQQFQQGAIGPLEKSLDLSNGLSHQEIHNMSELANFGYRMLHQFREAL